MLICYDSRAGKVKRFVEKLGMRAQKISDDLVVDEPFLFVTYTDGRGQVPLTSDQFLERNFRQLVAVAASGNKVFESFAASANVISARYQVPIIHKFEMAGTQRDVDAFRKWVIDNGAHFAQ
jgi:protein involved in ribonucleotide reduction